MLLSQTAEYALRSMAWMALLPPHEPIRAKDLSVAISIPPHYLSKVLRRLVLAGLLVSRKGQGGGFRLARSAGGICFLDILKAVDIYPDQDHCAFGWGACNDSLPCPLHGAWAELTDKIAEWAQTTTLADISVST